MTIRCDSVSVQYIRRYPRTAPTSRALQRIIPFCKQPTSAIFFLFPLSPQSTRRTCSKIIRTLGGLRSIIAWVTANQRQLRQIPGHRGPRSSHLSPLAALALGVHYYLLFAPLVRGFCTLCSTRSTTSQSRPPSCPHHSHIHTTPTRFRSFTKYRISHRQIYFSYSSLEALETDRVATCFSCDVARSSPHLLGLGHIPQTSLRAPYPCQRFTHWHPQ